MIGVPASTCGYGCSPASIRGLASGPSSIGGYRCGPASISTLIGGPDSVGGLASCPTCTCGYGCGPGSHPRRRCVPTSRPTGIGRLIRGNGC